MRMRITVAYDGTNFFGWQKQKTQPTVQAAIEDALYKIYGYTSSVTGSGRTDEGVHAYGQVAHFDVRDDHIESQKLISALNYFLPDSVRILNCEAVSEDFNARKSAKQKTYVYDMYYGNENPFLANRALRIKAGCDKVKMKAAAQIFIGRHDFNAFHCKGSSAKTTVRTVSTCKIDDITLCGSQGLRLSISADGFLYKMVRIIAGSLIRVGEGKLTENELSELLQNGVEWTKKIPAEPYGLYLYTVFYAENG